MERMDDVTPGELARRLDRLEAQIDNQFGHLTRQIEALQFVNRDTYEARHGALVERVADLEDARRWFSRALVTAFALPVIVAVILAFVLTR